MTQRDAILAKYEYIYGNIARTVTRGIAASTTSPEETYVAMKQGIPIRWQIALWANTIGRNPTDDEQRRYAEEYSGELLEWREFGEVKTGTRLDYFKSTDALFARTVMDRVRGCDLLLDLGCGWGHRMVDLHLLGLNAAFFGGDRSKHTQSLVKAVTGLFPGMRADWFRFDYLAPDFSAIPKTFKRVALASWHAIEQVTTLGPTLFDAALEHFRDAEIIGVHVEPVTFQIDPTLTAQRDYSVEKGYNLDLVETLRNHPGISVTEEVALICALGGADAALVTWKENRRKS